MQLNKLQLNLLEHDYGRRQLMVPRSGSVKIFEFQSALAQKCAAQVEMEEVNEVKAAAIQSFKRAVAAVCPLHPPTQRIGNRKIASISAGVLQGNRQAEYVVDQSIDMAKRPTRGESQARIKPSPTLPPRVSPPRQLNPEARPFAPRQPCCTRARARRIRRQRRNLCNAAALASDGCLIRNSKQRRAEQRKPLQETWQALQQAGPFQHGGEVQRIVELHTDATPPVDLTFEVKVDCKKAHLVHHEVSLSDAAECALAASRDRREIRREAQSFSNKWCGAAAKSIFDVPTPPRKFIDRWHSRYTPHMGEYEFGTWPLNLYKLHDKRAYWTVHGSVVRFDDRDEDFGAKPKPVIEDDDDDFFPMPWNLPM